MQNAFCYLDPTPLFGLGGVRRSKVHCRMFVPLKAHGLRKRQLHDEVRFCVFAVLSIIGWFGQGLSLIDCGGCVVRLRHT